MVVDGYCTASGFWKDEEGGVRYNFEDHVAGVLVDGCMWVGVEIIHQHDAFF